MISQFTFAIISFILGFWVVGPDLKPELLGASIGFAIALLVEFLIYLWDQHQFLLLLANCTLKPKKELRLTISYLFNIEVNGKYLLVKSHRIPDTYQPVGGVYKYFNPEGKRQLDDMTITTDTNIANDDVNEHDLRVKMSNRKHLKLFLKWFAKGENRETDPWREFYEELIEPGILPHTTFPYIHYYISGQHIQNIHFDEEYRIDTFKYADIYKLKFINLQQEQAIRELARQSGNEFIWVTEKEIRKKKSNCGKLIAEHSHKIFTTTKLK